MPFRWPSVNQDIMLATEVAARKPSKAADWEEIADVLSHEFSTAEKEVELKGRACRERFDRLIVKYKEDDKKSLKRSGTEEDYSLLHQLLEDMEEQRQKDKENKKNKEKEKKKEEMRAAALKGMRKRKSSDHDSDEDSKDDDSDSKNFDCADTKEPKDAKPKQALNRKKVTRLSAIELLEKKNETRAELKVKELEQRRLELDFQKEKYRNEEEERKEGHKQEMEERRMFLRLLVEKM